LVLLIGVTACERTWNIKEYPGCCKLLQSGWSVAATSLFCNNIWENGKKFGSYDFLSSCNFHILNQCLFRKAYLYRSLQQWGKLLVRHHLYSKRAQVMTNCPRQEGNWKMKTLIRGFHFLSDLNLKYSAAQKKVLGLLHVILQVFIDRSKKNPW